MCDDGWTRCSEGRFIDSKARRACYLATGITWSLATAPEKPPRPVLAIPCNSPESEEGGSRNEAEGGSLWVSHSAGICRSPAAFGWLDGIDVDHCG